MSKRQREDHEHVFSDGSNYITDAQLVAKALKRNAPTTIHRSTSIAAASSLPTTTIYPSLFPWAEAPRQQRYEDLANETQEDCEETQLERDADFESLLFTPGALEHDMRPRTMVPPIVPERTLTMEDRLVAAEMTIKGLLSDVKELNRKFQNLIE